MVKYVKVDIDRVVISGLSSGGQGVWDFCADYSKYFATAIPISAAQLEDEAYFTRYINLPIWTTNGGNDNNPDPGTATAVFTDFRNKGGELRQTFYPTMAHGVWNTFWNEVDYWPYLSARHKADPNVYFGHKDFCPAEAVNARLDYRPDFMLMNGGGTESLYQRLLPMSISQLIMELTMPTLNGLPPAIGPIGHRIL